MSGRQLCSSCCHRINSALAINGPNESLDIQYSAIILRHRRLVTMHAHKCFVLLAVLYISSVCASFIPSARDVENAQCSSPTGPCTTINDCCYGTQCWQGVSKKDDSYSMQSDDPLLGMRLRTTLASATSWTQPFCLEPLIYILALDSTRRFPVSRRTRVNRL